MLSFFNMNYFSYSDRGLLKLLGDFVKTTRLMQGKTQENLATAAGINRTTLVSLEKGEGANLLSFIQVLRALNALQVFEQFAVQQELSPLKVAEMQQKYQRKRAPKSKPVPPPKPLDW